MEAFHILEVKVAKLIENLKGLRAEKSCLQEDNNKLSEQISQLKSQIELMEHSMLNGHQNIEELNQEHELAKMMVGDLIKNIDILVERE